MSFHRKELTTSIYIFLIHVSSVGSKSNRKEVRGLQHFQKNIHQMGGGVGNDYFENFSVFACSEKSFYLLKTQRQSPFRNPFFFLQSNNFVYL